MNASTAYSKTGFSFPKSGMWPQGEGGILIVVGVWLVQSGAPGPISGNMLHHIHRRAVELVTSVLFIISALSAGPFGFLERLWSSPGAEQKPATTVKT